MEYEVDKGEWMMAPVEVFFSYAPEDNEYRENLLRQLAALKRKGIIDTWSDCDVRAGIECAKEINEHLNTAQIILLLISPDFIASDYYYGNEMIRAMERHNSGEACVIPVILRPVHWQETLIGKLRALPQDGKPVTAWNDLDSAFYDVAEGIHQEVKGLLTKPLLDEGKVYYDQDLYEKALTIFKQIIGINPECAEAFNYQGNIFDSFAQQAHNQAKKYEELSQQAYDKVSRLGVTPTKNSEWFYQEIQGGSHT
jgi:tetratricopeptide (TPR) repeat protein